MSDSELRQILERGSERLGLPFAEESIVRIIRISEGLPSKTHELALRAAQKARRTHADEVGPEQLHGIIDAALPEGRTPTGEVSSLATIPSASSQTRRVPTPVVVLQTNRGAASHTGRRGLCAM